MTPKAIQVYPLPDYRLFLTFDNGEQKIYNVKPLIRGKWYAELMDIHYFNTVKIAGLSVEWERGHDICPDDLYENSISI